MSITAPFRAAAMLLFILALGACSTTNTLEVAPPSLAPITTPMSAKYAAIVVDGSTGSVLYEVDSSAPRYPASLTKMMTLYLLFEAMQQGRVTAATEIPVSEYAARRPPTKIGFRPGDTIDADSAIRALVTKSANDVAVAVGEYLGGTEEQFAEMMTAKARSIGMRNTTFRNASGLPDAEQRTTARDMALLGLTLRKRFPAQFAYFADQNFMYRGRLVRGHNDLIGRVSGVDGIKTGYVRASGFNIVTSVNRDGRKLVVVVMGGETARKRNDHVEELIERYLPRAARGGV
ncbi:D-alanyl-D-alanine carboxypeptidase family protein [Mesorhizobium sp. ASY16-5R]|uniref:D-alanyl-D-alanine carboxypeptidase family protein n=1 Tax=Mesorhizobium sp. ASY16-5R TaxID=3445772 RepID=UPI003FA056E2